MNLSPKQIVNELDKYIIGQDAAKRAVAIALRNRYRRSKLSEADREEITPKNIIMKGPTGVGKTEIARRLAKLVKAPFIKVEATKYTEVGYVGRDVESMVRDLVECSIRLVREEKMKEVAVKAEAAAVSGDTRYTCPSAVPDLPSKFLLKVRKDTPPELGEKPMPMHGPHAHSRTLAPAARISESAPQSASMARTCFDPGETERLTSGFTTFPFRIFATLSMS